MIFGCVGPNLDYDEILNWEEHTEHKHFWKYGMSETADMKPGTH